MSTQLSTIDLLEKLEYYEDLKNKDKVTEIYQILQQRSIDYHGENTVESDFWREVYSESPNWVISIVSHIRPLTIHDIALVKSSQMFEALLSREDLDMEGYEDVIESLMDEDDETNNKRIEMIKQRASS